MTDSKTLFEKVSELVSTDGADVWVALAVPFLLAALGWVGFWLYNTRTRQLTKLQTEAARDNAVYNKSAIVTATYEVEGKALCLRIFNSGPSVARDVTVRLPDFSWEGFDSEIAAKFPASSMDANSAITLKAYATLSSPKKITAHLNWDDDRPGRHEKVLPLTI
jgi:hypothetical protein